jgi:cobalamin biosynthesis protein CbiG
MDKKIAGLLGAAAALTTMTAAQNAVAEPAPSAPLVSHRDLLESVPNALAALKEDDARLAKEKDGNTQLAQYHHHHHHHRRRRHHHHHHHHHH